MSSSRDHRKQLYERLVGQTVANDRFVVTNLLGFGGMGAVYEAIQKNMNRKVALKWIPTHDPTIVARFKREAHTISQLQHPNTITVFDFGQSEDGFLFLSMELLEGKTLTEEIKAGPMSPKRAAHIASQMCRSLAEAHKAGIVHRDVKPDNIILIRVDDDPDVVKVLDFGIAKAVMGEDDVQLTGDGRIIGTPRYMSPEQILAEPLDHRSDIYSLGCILFEMLCGAPPFQQSSTTALMISHTQDPPPAFAQQLDTGLLSQVPSGLERVVRRALSKRPADRPADCDQLREELEQSMKSPFPGPRERDSYETMGALPVHHTDNSGARPAPVAHPHTGSATASQQVLASPSGNSKALVGAIVALLVVIIGLLVAGNLVSERQGEQVGTIDEATQPGVKVVVAPEPVDEIVEPPPAPEAGVAVATIKIASTPEGARLYEGESFLGTTPMAIPVKAELNKYTYRLVLDGHEELVVTVPVSHKDKDGEVDREFRLKPVKVIERSPSKPGPTPTKRPPKQNPSKEDEGPSTPPLPVIPLLDDGPRAKVPIIE